MKYFIIVASIACSTTCLTGSTITPQIVNPIESQADALLDQQLTLAQSFANFMDSVVLLLSEKTAQAKATFHNLMVSLIEITQLLSTSKKSIQPQPEWSFDSVNEQLFDQLTDVAIMKTALIKVTRNKQKNAALEAKHKADVQKILNFFTGIMQNFFAIVQNPENKQNVGQGIIGMLGNIIAAGNTIIKDSNQAAGTSIEQMVDGMDENTKQQIIQIILNQK